MPRLVRFPHFIAHQSRQDLAAHPALGHPVAGITEAIDDIGLPSPVTEEGEAIHRAIGGAAPAGGDGHLFERRKEAAQGAGEGGKITARRIKLGQMAVGKGEGVAPLAQHQPPLRGGAVVMHKGAAIHHGSAVRKLLGGQCIRRRVGYHHIGGDQHDTAAKLAKVLHHGAVEGQHHLAGTHLTLRRLHPRRLARLKALHGRVLIDLDPQLPRHPQQAAHQERRLHRTGVGAVEPLQMNVGAALARQFTLFNRLPLVKVSEFQLPQYRLHQATLGLAGGGVAGALDPQLCLYVVRVAEAGDLVHRLFGSLHQPGGLLLAKEAL